MELKKELLRRIKKTKTHWIWMATRSPYGYGMLTFKGKSRGAHRLVYEVFKGIKPGRLRVLHKCDIPECVNPKHLFLGTQSDNVMDSVSKGRHWQKSKTHCHAGHPYSGKNLYTDPKGHRRCNECRRQNWHKRKNR